MQVQQRGGAVEMRRMNQWPGEKGEDVGSMNESRDIGRNQPSRRVAVLTGPLRASTAPAGWRPVLRQPWDSGPAPAHHLSLRRVDMRRERPQVPSWQPKMQVFALSHAPWTTVGQPALMSAWTIWAGEDASGMICGGEVTRQ